MANSRKLSWWERAGVIFAGISLLGAIESSSVSYWQYLVALNTQRPNVIIEKITSEFPVQASKIADVYPFQLSYENYGTSPALITGTDIEFLIASEMPDHPTYTVNDERYMLIPPSKTVSTEESMIPIKPEDKAAILNGTKLLFIYGKLFYSDVEKHNHHTAFAYRLYFKENGQAFFSPVGHESFWQYD